jgi:hypothetical protein
MSEIINQPPKPVIIAPSNIDSNERDYYISKLQNHTKKLHEILICSIIIGIIDFMVIGLSKFLFGNFLNKLSIFSLFVWSIICLYIYRYSYKTLDSIDISQYKKLVRCIYISISVCFLMEINLIYMLFGKVIIKYQIWVDYILNNLNTIQTICSMFGFTLFAVANAILPFISVFRLGKMRKIIKAVGNLQGQEYSVTYTVDQKV